MGAIEFTIGSTLEANDNSGVIKWTKLSNTTILDVEQNAGTVERVIQDGPFTATLKRDFGKTLSFVELHLSGNIVLDSSINVSFKYHKPYNNL